MTRPRPDRVFDSGLQQERTGLAWERTAVAIMVSGLLLARYAAQDASPLIAVVGVAQTVSGAVVLVWAGTHYEELHGILRQGAPAAQPLAAGLIGAATIVFSTIAVILAVTVWLTS